MTRFECTLKQRFSDWGPRTKAGPRRVPTGSARGFRKVVIVCTFFNNLRPICFQIFGGEFGDRRRLRGLVDMQRGRDATGGVEGLRAASGLVLAGRRSTQWNHGNEIRLTVQPMRVPTASAAAAAAAGVRSKSSQTASSQCDRLARNR